MTVNAITDTKKGRTGIAPTYLHTTLKQILYAIYYIAWADRQTQTYTHTSTKFNIFLQMFMPFHDNFMTI